MPISHVFYCTQCKNILVKMNDRYLCQTCAYSYPIIGGIPSFVDPTAVVESFNSSAFNILFKMEQKHFWHIGRKEIILDVLLRNIPNLDKCRMLEIGCGNGSVLAYLKQNGIDIEGGDIFMQGLELCRRRVDLGALYNIDVLTLPFVNEFDIIGIFDVLEHIDDDDKALSEINQALKPGGKILLTVPANKLLWSYFDIHSHHKRRYNKRELLAKLEQNGFIIRKISFFMFFLFPIFAVVRVINDILSKKDSETNTRPFIEMKTIPIINETCLWLLRIEKHLIRWLNLPFGASLLVLAEKK